MKIWRTTRSSNHDLYQLLQSIKIEWFDEVVITAGATSFNLFPLKSIPCDRRYGDIV
jgi:hypothetical protein